MVYECGRGGGHMNGGLNLSETNHRIPEERLWSVCFLILFVRFMLVPHSTYGTFLNLFVIINFLIITQIEGFSLQTFAVKRVVFLLALFMTIEHHSVAPSGKVTIRASTPRRKKQKR